MQFNYLFWCILLEYTLLQSNIAVFPRFIAYLAVFPYENFAFRKFMASRSRLLFELLRRIYISNFKIVLTIQTFPIHLFP
jgi:hypothetical protein